MRNRNNETPAIPGGGLLSLSPLAFADTRRARKTDKDITEDSVEGYAVKLATRYGVVQFKTEHLANGFMDRTFIWDLSCGCRKVGIDFIEFKRPKGGRYQPGQRQWHRKLKAMGHHVFLLPTRKHVDTYFKLRVSVCKHMKIRTNEIKDA